MVETAKLCWCGGESVVRGYAYGMWGRLNGNFATILKINKFFITLHNYGNIGQISHAG